MGPTTDRAVSRATNPTRRRSTRRRAIAGGAALIGAFVLITGCSGGGSSASSKGEFCTKLRAAKDALPTSSSDPQLGAEASKAFKDLAAAAPADVRNDALLISKVISQSADYFAHPTDQKAFGDAFAAALSSDFVSASQHLQKYAKDECGIDLEAGSSVTAPTPTTAKAGTSRTTLSP